MSANKWRHAVSTGGSAANKGPSPAKPPSFAPAARPRAAAPEASRPAWAGGKLLRYAVVLAALLAYPAVASSFFTFQIGAQSLILGIIALSLAFLAGYGGMVSLSQMTVAGIAGYVMAIFGHSAVSQISMEWPWWLASLLAVLLAVGTATLIGIVSVRTDGIYTIMITLAIGVAMFYLAQQNYTVFNGFQGFSSIFPPRFGTLDLRDPVPFYYLSLFFALLSYAAVKYIVRTPFGIALQGTRDNARRMRALGFNVAAHRVAAHAFAGLLAGIGGVLLVWYNARISPGTIGTSALINILIIAVIGGLRHPLGAFIGALAFVLLQNFAIDMIDRERFNLIIGGAFLLILVFSPDGLLGLWHRVRGLLRPARKQ
ncbi:branched-chain amino acid ABC transporter permease [Parapusillimonas granuli]|uniref:Branched-chain amino acid ABC transporter permease n=1 Tax=Parapusillimonas granuli TaxID=380911 RepID=A0A853FTH7_9BURK|nr:branched-chain amino acid ABC transporter permease [Parapusillimonas granuli]MBB5214902.1 branched-chain amino acid transport system permease protein [Parapusillimonas granuli]MEB2401248.1 branched-chain amino acid ABC transporter permease [Alcaligenaceae bacterium]NYT49224.1 branched-chain amino acid ABC transporter permease [Parapusillimonas granuli]